MTVMLRACATRSRISTTIYTNVPLFSKTGNSRQNFGRRVAEIDIIAFRGDQCDVFEVKCSYRIIKARKQLRRLQRLLPEVTNLFFFCGESGCLEAIL